MQFARALLMILGLSTFAACGGDSLADECKDACDNPCEGEQVTNVEACKTACDEELADLQETGCEDQATEVNDCLSVNSCETVDAADLERCSSEVTAFGRCLEAFCADNQSNPNC